MDITGAIPTTGKVKQLRACLLCSIVQTANDFRKTGCPNCDDILGMKGSLERVSQCTTTHFDGLVSMINPDDSWVARWQRIEKYVRGIYAIRVTGRIPEDVQEELDARGITYRPRESIQD